MEIRDLEYLAASVTAGNFADTDRGHRHQHLDDQQPPCQHIGSKT